MRRTLLLIPHEIASIPVFGFGWLLGLLAIACVVRLLYAKQHGMKVGQVLATEGFMWATAAAVVMFVFPMVELSNVDNEPVGLAIRGYGVMLLVGVSTAVALARYRAGKAGIDQDLILMIAPWAFFGGIIGARLFYVIQYRDQFFVGSLTQSLGRILRFTEGGLVVYGSFIGGGLAVAYFLYRHKLSIPKFGDVIVPCMFLGVFFGRMGCLMNGCCYGGRCEDGFLAVRFPPEAKVYSDQIASGELLGFTYDQDTRRILSVQPGSLADQKGIVAGDRLHELMADRTVLASARRDLPAEDVQAGVAVTISGKRHRWTPAELPAYALPVRAAQVISSVSSLVLCLFLCSLSRFHLRPGTVMLLGFSGYAVLRFVLEWVRVDEAGQFGTAFSISQWVSIVVLGLSILSMAWLYLVPHENHSDESEEILIREAT